MQAAENKTELCVGIKHWKHMERLWEGRRSSTATCRTRAIRRRAGKEGSVVYLHCFSVVEQLCAFGIKVSAYAEKVI